MAPSLAHRIVTSGLVAAAVSALGPVYYSSSDPSVSYLPSDAFFTYNAPGGYDDKTHFLSDGKRCNTSITFVFPQPSATFKFYGYQRPDGGKYSITVDNEPTTTVDYYNVTSGGDYGPLLIFSRAGLPNAQHTVRITNIFDARFGNCGQSGIDHFEITGNRPRAIAPTFPEGSRIGATAYENGVTDRKSYRPHISVGADAVANGGDGATIRVLFDLGASGAWVVWDGCTTPACAMHSRYRPSAQHFANASTTQTIYYGNGGPDQTLESWVVQDTVSVGGVPVLETKFGAGFNVPTDYDVDGNFGIAKSYCGGRLCVAYPNFVEMGYMRGELSAPAVSFYELAETDEPADGVLSMAGLGGVDRNKYTGAMDWIPVTQGDSWWIVGNFQRFVSGSAVSSESGTYDATHRFTHKQMLFDTGADGLLYVPSDDYQTLLAVLGAQDNFPEPYRIPCGATMTWSFGGTQDRNYTIELAAVETNSNGVCFPLFYDGGNIGNWLAGAPFLSQYYISFYFGIPVGIPSTMGLAQKNLASSAGSIQAVVGQA
ncbi:acid protease [Auricularia subglabra TFB-10046 SS5]|uniref:Acid protease n=1 Tax=Auricularia subglabra (strain TFB-10046 / SS5) TaxID=717982 RepID=J0WWK4_AURST|nr:acid protease [Auricularia subglabra TFB-10046 SS5]